MEFTEEQQTEVNRLMGEARTKANTIGYDKAMAESANAISEAKAEAKTKYDADMAKAKSDFDALKTTKAIPVDNTENEKRFANLELRVKRSDEASARGALESAAAKLNAIDPSVVAQLLKTQTKTDDSGNLVVINSAGQLKNNEEGKPMTVEQLCKGFLADKSFLVKSSGSSGAGSQGSTDTKSGSAKVMKRGVFDKLNPQERSDFHKSGGVLED